MSPVRQTGAAAARLAVAPAADARPPGEWGAEFRSTLGLAWPLIAAQLAQMSLNTTDVVMMGWLGPEQLAAGALAMSVIHPLLICGIGILSTVAALVAQALGASDLKGVRRSVRQGLWVAILVSAVMVPITLQTGPILVLLGQDPALAELAQGYAVAIAWIFPPALVFVAFRSFVAAHGSTSVVLVVTLVGVAANAVLNYGLMFGNFGLPRMELAGAGLSTVIVDILMVGLIFAYIHRHRRYRRYYVLARLWRPDWGRFFEVLRIGLPIGAMLLAETSLFAAAALMMGWLGTAQLAGHAVAIQFASLAFMVPMGLSQATVIRVGLAAGRGSDRGVGVAGWTSYGIAALFMTATCTIFLLFPEWLISAFLDADDPANEAAMAFAASYLVIAGLFQLVDGAQVVSAASLRGLSDTRTPMVAALFGYWLVGVPIAYVLGFVVGLDGVGVWLGLAAGLAFVAALLTIRFAMRGRFGLLRHLRRL